ncbi:MAG: DUF4358 domain-containing protein [Erysipelotrichaceae bacterium]|nr:DUF4358 domain-containing protein [Erysipelotrichaceae bacterium]
MKRFLMALACLLLVTGCSNADAVKNIDIKELGTKIMEQGYDLPSFMEADADVLKYAYNLDESNVEQYAVYLPMMNVHASEIALFKAVPGHEAEVQKAIDERLALLETSWATYLPEQYDLVKNHKLIVHSPYYFLVISDHADDIAAQIEAEFK